MDRSMAEGVAKNFDEGLVGGFMPARCLDASSGKFCVAQMPGAMIVGNESDLGLLPAGTGLLPASL